MFSDCCGAIVQWQDICSRCGEHCEVIRNEIFDSALLAYSNGQIGEPVDYVRDPDEIAWSDECRYCD